MPNPQPYHRVGKEIPQMRDRIGSGIQTHYPLERALGEAITRQEAGMDLGGDWPVKVPPFMDAIIEQISIQARKSRFVDHASGVSARFSASNWRTMVASARRRAIQLGESPAVPRIRDLAHLASSGAGKLELHLIGSHPITARTVTALYLYHSAPAAACGRRARASALSGGSSSKNTPNSSPPTRGHRSDAWVAARRTVPRSRRTRSPPSCPSVSLTRLK